MSVPANRTEPDVSVAWAEESVLGRQFVSGCETVEGGPGPLTFEQSVPQMLAIGKPRVISTCPQYLIEWVKGHRDRAFRNEVSFNEPYTVPVESRT